MEETKLGLLHEYDMISIQKVQWILNIKNTITMIRSITELIRFGGYF